MSQTVLWPLRARPKNLNMQIFLIYGETHDDRAYEGRIMPLGVYYRTEENKRHISEGAKIRWGSVESRFWAKVEKTPTCWIWKGKISNTGGYGRFWNGIREVGAARFSYELHKGIKIDGLVPDHLCKNHACVNPEHLEAVTQRENTARWNAERRFCKRGHEFVDGNLVSVPYGRSCLTCHREKSRNWRKTHILRRGKWEIRA